ncbi:DNA-binding domain-containing protein [Solimicrobium silvestre]|uniref:Uncharacterized protein conserved in bacteria (DUF2063) n=1 Tax=Solimicrobium silvestre TaxID=2099400 RepID=A0A2S9H5G4_9BURK|nr:DNA-binding domain-containing protein [Solimicrobium silvestre]PRC95230.1 Uncharacterized protein conserved in bacteria (DUF2063) [Solimicrobium silvestre]
MRAANLVTPQLTTLQHDFASALINLNSLDPALASFKGDPDLNRERFGLYRGNLIAIWQQTCVNAYPVLQQLVGAEFFGDLARAYGLNHASQSGNLAEFGAALSSFIATLENCRAYPYLSDVAALEWQVHRSYYLEQRSPATLAQLAGFAPELLGDLQFTLQPSCVLLESPWAVVDIWQAHQGTNTPFPEQLASATYCLIWREHHQTNISAISAASYAALQALNAGQPLGQAFESALAIDPEFALPTELADWFGKQLFSNISHN